MVDEDAPGTLDVLEYTGQKGGWAGCPFFLFSFIVFSHPVFVFLSCPFFIKALEFVMSSR